MLCRNNQYQSMNHQQHGQLVNPTNPAFQRVINAKLTIVEGDVKIINLSVKYSTDGPEVLNKVSFDVKSRERVGCHTSM
jgi:ABC-type bacteriocin/lantibiotic exporter with double-glycine peptidase domain